MTARLSTILPLENSDRLTRIEFERRYQAMPHLKKAELIEGVVYINTVSDLMSTFRNCTVSFKSQWSDAL